LGFRNAVAEAMWLFITDSLSWQRVQREVVEIFLIPSLSFESSRIGTICGKIRQFGWRLRKADELI
jgi:hypothetical protein